MKVLVLLSLLCLAKASLVSQFGTTFKNPTACDQYQFISGNIGIWRNPERALTEDDYFAHNSGSPTQTFYCTGYDIPAPLPGATNIETAIYARINPGEPTTWNWRAYPFLPGEGTVSYSTPWPGSDFPGLSTKLFTAVFNISESRTDFGIALNLVGTTSWIDILKLAVNYEIHTDVDSLAPNSLDTSTTEVNVFGSGFWNSSNILCRYGYETPVQAQYMSPTWVICPVPVLSPGEYPLEIAPQGGQYTQNNVMLTMEAPGTSGTATTGTTGTSGTATTGTTGTSGTATTGTTGSSNCNGGCVAGITVGSLAVLSGAGVLIFVKMRSPLGVGMSCWESLSTQGRVSGPSERSTLPPTGPPREMSKKKTRTRPTSQARSVLREPSEYLSRHPLEF